MNFANSGTVECVCVKKNKINQLADLNQGRHWGTHMIKGQETHKSQPIEEERDKTTEKKQGLKKTP